MTGKQWITLTIAHRSSGRIPFNFMLSPPVQKTLEQIYGSDLEHELGLPIRMNAPVSIKPLYADPGEYGPTIRDEFGVVWSTSVIDRGSPVVPCLSSPDISRYHFPDPAQEYRFDGLGEWCSKQRDQHTIIWVGDLWERATFMRGMQALMLDVAAAPGAVQRLLEGITEYILGTMEILFNRFQFDGIAVSDDYGSQQGMIISPEAWRALIKPYLARIYASARQQGRTVFHHSCGHIVPIIPDLIEIGLDILHPIQPEAMNVFALKREFGKDLTFCGGLGTQQLLPYGTPAEIRREIRRLKSKLGQNGGYILEPGITVQADVPPANLIAMIEEARAAEG